MSEIEILWGVIAVLVVVVFISVGEWTTEVSRRKFWESDHDFWKKEYDKEYTAKMQLLDDRDAMRREVARLKGKLTFLRESLGEEEGEPS